MNKIEKIIEEISRIKEIVEKWNETNQISAIERKIVKNYLAQIYDKLHEIKPMPIKENTNEDDFIELQKENFENDSRKIENKRLDNTEIQIIKENTKNQEITRENQQTIATKLQQNKRFLSDDFEQREEIILTPINDLSKGIGLNDKFLFSKELFGGNALKFESTIAKINSLPNFDDAMKYISENFNWGQENQIAKRFYTLVKRKFM